MARRSADQPNWSGPGGPLQFSLFDPLPYLLMGGGLLLCIGLLALDAVNPTLFASPVGPSLAVVLEESGETVLTLPLGNTPGSPPCWEIHWQHSVAGVIVRDRYCWQTGRMILTDSWTPLLDIAGLGHTPGRGELRSDGAGGHWIADIHEPVPGNAYRMRIGSATAPTTLVHQGQAYALSLGYPHAVARITVFDPYFLNQR